MHPAYERPYSRGGQWGPYLFLVFMPTSGLNYLIYHRIYTIWHLQLHFLLKAWMTVEECSCVSIWYWSYCDLICVSVCWCIQPISSLSLSNWWKQKPAYTPDLQDWNCPPLPYSEVCKHLNSDLIKKDCNSYMIRSLHAGVNTLKWLSSLIRGHVHPYWVHCVGNGPLKLCHCSNTYGPRCMFMQFLSPHW